MANITSLGTRIRNAREEAKLSQLQVGVALGVSDKTISGYESDRISPPLDKLLKLVDLLKKPAGFFLGMDNKDYKISSRLRAIEIMLRDVRRELREIKTVATKLDD
jgi:transcriptional regulator with XRE-family HTH domain